MHRFLVSFCALGFALLSAWPAFALSDDVYIWQRRWTPALAQAMAEAAPLVHRWRVLAAEMDASGRWQKMQPDFAALQASGRPVVATIRIEGRATPTTETVPALLDAIAQWREAGLLPAALEVDFDAPTSKLQAYGYFLRRLRNALPDALPLIITALPTWLNSKELPALLALADESVLQVHAVANPYGGKLFDHKYAAHWAKAYAQQTAKPWRLALPSYGSRVAWNERGDVVAVDSESSSLVSGSQSALLFAEPVEVAALRKAMIQAPLGGLVGFAWFRLPVAQDRYAWTMPSFIRVLRNEPLDANAVLIKKSTGQAGFYDLFLRNAGNVDIRNPQDLPLDDNCSHGDGANGYDWGSDQRFNAAQRDFERYPVLRSYRLIRLRPGAEIPVGWAYCSGATRG